MVAVMRPGLGGRRSRGRAGRQCRGQRRRRDRGDAGRRHHPRPVNVPSHIAGRCEPALRPEPAGVPRPHHRQGKASQDRSRRRDREGDAADPRRRGRPSPIRRGSPRRRQEPETMSNAAAIAGTAPDPYRLLPHRLRARGVCRLSRRLARDAGAAFAADERHQRDLERDHRRRAHRRRARPGSASPR